MKRNFTLLALVFITASLCAQLPVFPPVAHDGPFPTGKEVVRNDAPLNQENARTIPIEPTEIIMEYTAYKGTPEVDGNYDEDAWNKIPWTEFQCNESRSDVLTEVGYMHAPGFAPTIWGGNSDMSAWFKILHDADNVYVITMRIDDDIDNTGTTLDNPGGIWQNDAYQMVLDSRLPGDYDTPSPGAEVGFGHIGIEETYHFWSGSHQNPATQLELADGNSVSTSPSSTGKAIIYQVFPAVSLGSETYDLHIMEVAFKKYPDKFTDGTTSMLSLAALDRDAGVRFNTILQWAQGVVNKDKYNYGSIAWSPESTPPATSISSKNIAKAQLHLSNYPNPVGDMTHISYNLKNEGHVSLKVYDVSGKIVKELVSERQSAGPKTIDFDTSSLSAGVYFYTLKTGSYSLTNKILK